MPPYLVIGLPTTRSASARCLAALRRAGYRAEEISRLVVVPTGVRLPGWTGVGWIPAVGAVAARGALAGGILAAGSLDDGLAACGVPAYAAHRCVAELARGGSVIAVHTANAYESTPLVELFAAAGVAACAATRALPAASRQTA